MKHAKEKLAFMALAGALIAGAAAATAGTPQDILNKLVAQAKADGSWTGSRPVKRGQAFFLAKHSGGKKKTPSCSTCHTKNPRNSGRTRVGKVIQPMALSKTPDRYSDPKKVAKWFRRNCHTVLGRPCTPMEKGDFITFMISQ